MKKRGLFFTSDVLLALVILFLVILILVPVYPTIKKPSRLGSDIIHTLSNLRIGEIDNEYVRLMIANGEVSNLNNSVLEQIAEFYIEDPQKAEDLATQVLSAVETNENFGIWLGNSLVYSSNSTPIDSANNVRISSQVISGIKTGFDLIGFSARSFLTNNFRTDYFYFGGYVGDGNISLMADYNGQINSATLEIATNKQFSVYVNGFFSGTYSGISDSVPVTFSLPAEHFSSGSNLVEFKGEDIYFSGGFLKIEYDAEVEYEQPFQYNFPGIEGLVNLYDGVYIPGDLESMEVFLHLDSASSVFLNIGNVTIFNGTTNGPQTISITDSEISALLDYGSLSMKTVPLRLGLENISYLATNEIFADVFSVSALPSSFNSVPGGIIGVREANRAFITSLLSYEVSRVGLVGISKDTIEPDYYHNLSRNFTSLNNTLNNWEFRAGVCLCCGINNATQSLLDQSSPENIRSVVIVADREPTSSCDTNDARFDAVTSACNAYRDHEIRFNTIALGTNVKGQDMLKEIANCSNGTYYQGNYEDLFDLYQETAQDILELIHHEQTVLLTEGEIYTKIYPDSFIKFEYSKSPTPYGLYLYTEENFNSNSSGNFSIPAGSDLVSASIVSYSGSRWTDTAFINGEKFYDLSDYGQDFIPLGDPYFLSIPNSKVNLSSSNEVILTTALRPGEPLAGSIHNKIIYVISKNLSAFSSISSVAQGCQWNVEFDDSTNMSFYVPANYSGPNVCYYSSLNQNYNSNDAYQSSTFNLLKSMDLNNDGRINFKFDSRGLGVSSTTISGIPYPWSTEIKVQMWD